MLVKVRQDVAGIQMAENSKCSCLHSVDKNTELQRSYIKMIQSRETDFQDRRLLSNYY